MNVSEIFYSIQGEGVHVGYPTVFLRLFACDLRCTWCDSMYAVEGRDFKVMSRDEVLESIFKFKCKRLCITGGEPLLQADDVEFITKKLINKGYKIVLETSGHKAPPKIFSDINCVISMDCKCPSSGMENRMDYSLYEKLDEKDQIKFVISDSKDFDFANKVLSNINTEATVIFQPVYGSDTKWLAETVLRNNKFNVRVIPQIHKIFWGEKRGV